MALTSEATTVWTGDLKSGTGNVTLDSSTAAEFPVTWQARAVGTPNTTNPEELLGAAHSACFSMALANGLSAAGHVPDSIQTTAAITFEAGVGVVGSHLLVSAKIPGLTEEEFVAFAEDAKANCPISKALAGIPITIEAELA
ncbi:OsmC family peroxiredoxin [Cryobacterium sp. TMT1-21]|uniref:OsmC family peroxiredoxin n=1 Tax=Cryobacterium shii TaxID=1259235 RepID=A0AAQ2C554_9MICO|nr:MULTISPECIES: OsmC family peroxiredoxin [Cryobacterium]TFC43831.1 OsmC family peroxiredoxin [Cryobacterium shii]TFC80640.1 OsmC family peroxiredoxin [Cryobacterium sp. TmT2-59]TFD14024.1 OsmC family peroxiredoxin [Cryobacterium sp. TMT1-21]TFD17136.1 OsmC family peroxiredoxin [Cryobacterium sp. TMT4-10]TFD23221.1 OsmC family peroxiredoxin [Cryobacterium sp. TMT2-23]